MDSVLCLLATRTAALSLTSRFVLNYVISWNGGGGGGDGVHFTEAEMRTNRLVCKPNFGNIKALTQNL